MSKLDEIEARLLEKLQANYMDDADLRLVIRAVRQLGAWVMLDERVADGERPFGVDDDVLDLLETVSEDVPQRPEEPGT